MSCISVLSILFVHSFILFYVIRLTDPFQVRFYCQQRTRSLADNISVVDDIGKHSCDEH